MPGPGFKPGLLQPQRSVLTTRRSRLHQTSRSKNITKTDTNYTRSQSILSRIRSLPCLFNHVNGDFGQCFQRAKEKFTFRLPSFLEFFLFFAVVEHCS